MRKRFFHERVCSCTPHGVTYMQTRLLRNIVNREAHPIRCASTSGRKALRGLTIGDLCAEAGHLLWARQVYGIVIDLIHDKDYDEWASVWFNPRYVSFRDVISDGICEVLGRRIDDLMRSHGLDSPQPLDSWEYMAGDGWYDTFSYEKYDNDWADQRQHYLQLRSEAMKWQATERLFRQAQGDLPPQAQDFFHYWEDFDPTAQDMYFKIDDWD